MLFSRKLMGFAAGAAGLVMLFGASLSAGAEEIYTLTQEAAAAQEFMTVNMDTNVKASVKLGSSIYGESAVYAGGNGTFTMQMQKEPYAISLVGNVNGGAIGFDAAIGMEMYMLQDESGDFKVYARVTGIEDAEGWEYTAIPAEQTAQMMDMVQNPTAMIESLGIDYSKILKVGNVKRRINGVDCIQLLSKMTDDDILPIMRKAFEMAGTEMSEYDKKEFENIMSYAEYLLDGLVVNGETDIDPETYLPVRAYSDMKGTKLDSLSSFLEAMIMENITIEGDFTLPSFKIDLDKVTTEAFYDYETPVNIVVPEEALQAEKAAGGYGAQMQESEAPSILDDGEIEIPDLDDLAEKDGEI